MVRSLPCWTLPSSSVMQFQEWRKAAEQGSAIAAAMEGVEQQWGTEFAGPHAFIENLRDHMFKPSLSTIITENSSVPAVSASDLVTVAAKKMREHRVNSVVVMTGNILQGIITGTKSVPRGDTRRKGDDGKPWLCYTGHINPRGSAINEDRLSPVWMLYS
ncbi:hypothetical protein VPH35_063667 [Triticum aestivum]